MRRLALMTKRKRFAMRCSGIAYNNATSTQPRRTVVCSVPEQLIIISIVIVIDIFKPCRLFFNVRRPRSPRNTDVKVASNIRRETIPDQPAKIFLHALFLKNSACIFSIRQQYTSRNRNSNGR